MVIALLADIEEDAHEALIDDSGVKFKLLAVLALDAEMEYDDVPAKLEYMARDAVSENSDISANDAVIAKSDRRAMDAVSDDKLCDAHEALMAFVARDIKVTDAVSAYDAEMDGFPGAYDAENALLAYDAV